MIAELCWAEVWFGRRTATAAAAAAATDQPQVVVKPHDLAQSSFTVMMHDWDGKDAYASLTMAIV